MGAMHQAGSPGAASMFLNPRYTYQSNQFVSSIVQQQQRHTHVMVAEVVFQAVMEAASAPQRQARKAGTYTG